MAVQASNFILHIFSFFFYFILLRGFSKAGVPFPLYFVLLTQRPVDPVLASQALHLCLPDKGLNASQI